MMGDFSYHHQMRFIITKKPLRMMGIMSEVAVRVWRECPMDHGSKYVAQPVNDFLFLWAEKDLPRIQL